MLENELRQRKLLLGKCKWSLNASEEEMISEMEEKKEGDREGEREGERERVDRVTKGNGESLARKCKKCD